MERDFTSKCYHDFLALLNPLDGKNWRGIPDWLNGHAPFLMPSLSELLTNWGDILDETARMELYYKDLLDRHRASKEKIRDVFERVSDLDTSFTNGANGHFGYCIEQLDAYRECINSITDFVYNGYSSGKLNFHSGLVDTMMIIYLRKLQIYMLPAPQHQFTASTFSDISQADKEAFVRLCETTCPLLAETLAERFDDPDWTEQEKLDIKFLIYSAPEPYRAAYLGSASRYQITVFQYGSEDSQGVSGSQYHYNFARIFLLDDDYTLRNNYRGPYTTFFHESGHALDNYFGAYDVDMSMDYEVNGQNLFDCMVNDARKYVSDLINYHYSDLDTFQKELLLTSLNLSDQAYFNYEGHDGELTEPLKECRDKIKELMTEDLNGEANTAASDVYGGITNNAIIGFFGHRNDKTYWYDENGVTKCQTLELWAEFFAAQMIHDEEALASIKAHFPTAYPLLEEMAREMAAQ